MSPMSTLIRGVMWLLTLVGRSSAGHRSGSYENQQTILKMENTKIILLKTDDFGPQSGASLL